VKGVLIGLASLMAASLIVLGLGAAAVVAALPGVGRDDRTETGADGGGSVPDALVPLYQGAATLCPVLSWTLLAAQGRVESRYRADADSPVGASGIAQFMPGTWATWGTDGDGDGRADVLNPADAIPSQSRYDCALIATVAGIPGEPVELMLAAYNAGPGNVRRYQGIPPFAETRAYVAKILGLLGGAGDLSGMPTFEVRLVE